MSSKSSKKSQLLNHMQAIPDSKVVGLLRKVNMVLRKQRSPNDADQ